MKLKEIQTLRKAQVIQYQQSGQSMEAWCNEHQVNLYTLRYWLTKLTKVKQVPKTTPSVPWVALSSVTAPLSLSSVGITLRIGDYSLCVEPGFDPLLLRQVLQVLQSS
jgi:hypothetical protein